MSKNQAELRINHNVYILGAGFSRDAGLPLMGDFLTTMRNARDWLQERNRDEEVSAIDDVLKFRLEAASAAYWVNLNLENIEELFSLAAANNRELEGKTRLAIAATLDCAEEMNVRPPTSFSVAGKSTVFNSWETPPKIPPWAKLIQKSSNPPGVNPSVSEIYGIDHYSLYTARLLGMFGNGQPAGENTFITFNYDTILENSLRKLHVSFDYGSNKIIQAVGSHSASQGSSVPILKLHGSVNWARRTTDASAQINAFDNYNALRAEKLIPELVPPTWKKAFDTPLEDVWETAIQRLKSATRVVIVGFSLPPADLHFKYLLAAGLQQNISLQRILFVNPDTAKDLEKKARTLLRNSYVDSQMIVFDTRTLHQYCCGTMGSTLKDIGRLPSEPGVTISP